MYIRLEYSESAGHFHFSALTDKGVNTNGYAILCSKITCRQAEQFCEQLNSKFPEYKAAGSIKRVSFSWVHKEFLDFLDEELNSMREVMDSTYEQRSRVYRKQ